MCDTNRIEKAFSEVEKFIDEGLDKVEFEDLEEDDAEIMRQHMPHIFAKSFHTYGSPSPLRAGVYPKTHAFCAEIYIEIIEDLKNNELERNDVRLIFECLITWSYGSMYEDNQNIEQYHETEMENISSIKTDKDLQTEFNKLQGRVISEYELNRNEISTIGYLLDSKDGENSEKIISETLSILSTIKKKLSETEEITPYSLYQKLVVMYANIMENTSN